jgi:hypothetical protein
MSRMLFYKMDERDYDVLKTFLAYLNLLPDFVYGINGKNIIVGNIPYEENIAEILSKI